MKLSMENEEDVGFPSLTFMVLLSRSIIIVANVPQYPISLMGWSSCLLRLGYSALDWSDRIEIISEAENPLTELSLSTTVAYRPSESA